MNRILVVDDEPQIRRMLRTSLPVEDFLVEEADTGTAALERGNAGGLDLVLLDLGLPDMDGQDVIRRLRRQSQVPIIVLTVRHQESEKVRALDSGADDYVTKPFGMAELVARMRAVVRRHSLPAEASHIFEADGLRIDFSTRLVTLDGAVIRLSPKQYDLLMVLARNAGRVMTHQQLLTAVWGPAHIEDVEYLRVFVRKLRSKIEAEPARPRYLMTELGVGYRLRSADQPIM